MKTAKSTAVLSAALALALLATGCGFLVTNTIKNQSQSPDKKYTAVLFIRDAGATTACSPQIELVRGGPVKTVKGWGNIFIGDKDERVKIVWQSPTNLVIYATPDCRATKHVKI